MVSGSRGWEDPQPVESRLGEVHAQHEGDIIVIHTDGRGVDKIAAAWCERWHVAHVPFEAEWATYGYTASTRRAVTMLDFLAEQRDEFGHTVELLAFRLPDNDLSKLLDHTVKLARGQRITGGWVRAAA